MTTVNCSLLSLTLSDSSQHEDARLLDDPVRVEEQSFEQRQEMWEQLLTEHVGKNIQSRSGTLPCRGKDPSALDRKKGKYSEETLAHHSIREANFKHGKTNTLSFIYMDW